MAVVEVKAMLEVMGAEDLVVAMVARSEQAQPVEQVEAEVLAIIPVLMEEMEVFLPHLDLTLVSH
jgi:hypothetical protein